MCSRGERDRAECMRLGMEEEMTHGYVCRMAQGMHRKRTVLGVWRQWVRMTKDSKWYREQQHQPWQFAEFEQEEMHSEKSVQDEEYVQLLLQTKDMIQQQMHAREQCRAWIWD